MSQRSGSVRVQALAKPEILPRHLRIRIHHAGLQIYESEADIVTSLQQVGKLIEIDRQRTQSSFFGVITGHTERLRTKLVRTGTTLAGGHAPSDPARSSQLAAGDTLRAVSYTHLTLPT